MTITQSVQTLPVTASTPTRPPEPDEKHPSPGREHRSTWAAVLASAAPAVLVSAGVFAWMWQRSAAGVNTAGLQMPAMGLQHRVAYWWPFLMGETLGISALIWSYAGVLVGLSFSTRSRWFGLSRARRNELHRQLSLTSLLLIAGHVLFVAVGSMNGAMNERTVNVAEALLPFQTSWNGIFYNTGVFSFYLAILLGPTYYLRHRIGARWWRIAHRASLAVYILAVWHTLGFDDFDFNGPYRLALWAAQIPLVAMLCWRLAAPVGSLRRRWRTQQPREAGVLVMAGLLGVLLAVVGSGQIGGKANPFHPTAATHTTPAHPAPGDSGAPPAGTAPAPGTTSDSGRTGGMGGMAGMPGM